MKIKELMVTDILTLRPSESLESAARKFTDHRVSGAPVVDEEMHLVGILSETDILKHMKVLVDDEVGMRYLSDTTHSLSLFVVMAEKGHEVTDAVISRLKIAKVGKAMTTSVFVAKPEDTIESVAASMINHNVDRIPIVDEDKLVGIVTKSDFARYLATGTTH